MILVPFRVVEDEGYKAYSPRPGRGFMAFAGHYAVLTRVFLFWAV